MTLLFIKIIHMIIGQLLNKTRNLSHRDEFDIFINFFLFTQISMHWCVYKLLKKYGISLSKIKVL